MSFQWQAELQDLINLKEGLSYGQVDLIESFYQQFSANDTLSDKQIKIIREIWWEKIGKMP